MDSLERRRATVTAALGFMQLTWTHKPPVIRVLEKWMGSWAGVGAVIEGMHRQDYDVQLTQFPHGWRANFYDTGNAHSVVRGSAWEKTAAKAVQKAAWEAL